MVRESTNDNRSQCGALSVEATFVLGLLAVLVFVLFPPVLKKLNQGAELVKSKSAIVSAMAEKRSVTYIDYSGTVYLAAPDIIIDSIQVTAKNIALQTSNDATVKIGLIKFTTCTDGAGNTATDPVIACTTGDCCQVYTAKTDTYADCTSAEVTALENVSKNYPHCEGTNPYGQPVIVYNDTSTMLSTGFLGVTNMALMNKGYSVPTYYGIDLMNWGFGRNAFASILEEGESLRCPLSQEDSTICCTVTPAGRFDLSTCSPCTARDLEACVTEG